MTRHAWLVGWGAFLVVIAVLILQAANADAASNAHAATNAKAPAVPVAKFVATPPDSPCTEDQLGDIYIINGVWFECICDQHMFTDPTCDWHELFDPADDPQALKKLKRASKRIMRYRGGLYYVPRVRPVVA